MELLQKYGHLIGGRMVYPEGAEYSPDYNPATGEVLAEVVNGTAADVDAAVRAAQEAAAGFGALPNVERARLLNAIADMLDREADTIAAVETADVGKCIGESSLQAHGGADMFRYFAACIGGENEILRRHPGDAFSAIYREPLGVVGLIIPWNAPTMISIWKLAPALAAGNCVVIKPASGAALPILELALRLQKILPAGVVNVVCGKGSTIGDALIANPGISKVSFTGSTKTGRGIAAAAGQRLIPATVELGGKSPLVIYEDADLEKAVQFAMLGTLSSTGAVCVAGSRVLVQSSVYDKVVALFRDAYTRVRVGDPTQPEMQMGPVINRKQFDKVMDYIQKGQAEGATLLAGGKQLHGGVYDSGLYLEPTLFGDVKNDMTIAREEIFGPVLSLIRFEDEAEAIAIANDTEYGLGAGVFTRDINRAIRTARAIQAGTVWVNTYLNSCPGSAFGGYKNSGYGRELHAMALDAYSNVKNINVDFAEGGPIFF